VRFSRPLQRFAFATGLSTWHARHKPVRRILMLHGVGGADMPAAGFEQGLDWLARRFRIVPLGQMIDDIAAGREPGRGGEIAITFDDGLRNQFDLAYPVLRRLGVPATFFVCPDLIEGRRWIWTQEARTRLQSMSPERLREFAHATNGAAADVESLVMLMKQQPLAERLREEERLRAHTPDFAPSDDAHRRFDPLSWGDLECIDPTIVTIGSHTLSHPILPTIDDDALQREIVESRRILEERLGRTVDLFCYPNGSMDQRVRKVVARAYRAAVTTEYGFVEAEPDLHRLHRIPATPSLPLLAWRMHRPGS
jgi:peptidoglycan/xylan/chitin deacetylase (PgdA/CDA1 family)